MHISGLFPQKIYKFVISDLSPQLSVLNERLQKALNGCQKLSVLIVFNVQGKPLCANGKNLLERPLVADGKEVFLEPFKALNVILSERRNAFARLAVRGNKEPALKRTEHSERFNALVDIEKERQLVAFKRLL